MADLPSVLINFGNGLFKLIQNPNFMYGLAVVAFGFGMFTIFRTLLEKYGPFKGTKAPNAVSGLITVILIGTVFRKYSNPELFFTAVGTLVGFLLFMGSSIALILFGVNYNKNNKNSSPQMAKIVLYFCLFFASSILVMISSDNGIMTRISFFNGLDNFREYIDTLFTIVMWISGFMVGLSVIGGFKGSFGSGSFSNSVLGRKMKENSAELKNLDGTIDNIKHNIQRGNDIYKIMAPIVQTKKPIDANVINYMKAWETILKQLDTLIPKLNNVDSSKVEMRLNRFKTTHKDLEEIKQDSENLLRILKDMQALIVQLVSNPTKNDNYSVLYNVCINWVNFVKYYGKLDGDAKVLVELYKQELDYEKANLDALEKFKSLKITKKKVSPELKKRFGEAVNSFFLDLSNKYNSNDLIIINAIFENFLNYINTSGDLGKKLEIFDPTGKTKNNLINIANVILELVRKEKEGNNFVTITNKVFGDYVRVIEAGNPQNSNNGSYNLSDLRKIPSYYTGKNISFNTELGIVVNRFSSDSTYFGVHGVIGEILFNMAKEGSNGKEDKFLVQNGSLYGVTIAIFNFVNNKYNGNFMGNDWKQDVKNAVVNIANSL